MLFSAVLVIFPGPPFALFDRMRSSSPWLLNFPLRTFHFFLPPALYKFFQICRIAEKFSSALIPHSFCIISRFF